MYGEADLIGGPLDDFDENAGGGRNLLSRVGAVGKDDSDEGEGPTRSPEDRHGAVAILDAGVVDHDHERPAVGIDERVAFAPLYLFAGIIAARAAGLRRLDRLAVDDRCRGARLAACALTIRHDQCVIDPLEQTGVAPRMEPSIHGPPRRKVARQESPWTTRPHYIEDTVHDLPQRPRSWATAAVW